MIPNDSGFLSPAPLTAVRRPGVPADRHLMVEIFIIGMPGDIVLFDWNGDGVPGHTELVTSYHG
jgi:hypothetical protein